MFKRVCIILFMMVSQIPVAQASGKQSLLLDKQALDALEVLDLVETPKSLKTVKYGGTIEGFHVVLVEQVQFKGSQDKQKLSVLSRPSHMLSAFKVPAQNYSIINGWSLAVSQGQSMRLHSFFCPDINLKRQMIVLASNPEDQKACVSNKGK